MRKKKILLALVGVCAGVCAFAACGVEEAPTTYNVTFRQTGYEDVVLPIEEGKDVSNFPKIQPKKGYTVEWDRESADITGVTDDIVITTKETPNTYTITYDAKGGTVVSTTQAVVYDATYTLYEPTCEGYEFIAWRKDGEVFANTGTWTIDGDISLVADWRQLFTVTFKQDGQPDIVRTVAEGETLELAEIPAVQSNRTGYNIEWNFEEVSLENITSNLVVNAKETPKKYTITYDAQGGQVEATTQTVTYDSAYTLYTPTRADYTFTCWLNGETAVAQTGTWKVASDVTLKADWVEIVSDYCTVTFAQVGQEIKTVQVEKGGDLSESDIPAVQPKTGYDVEWDFDNLSLENIQENITVVAKETPKTYKIIYRLDGAVYGEVQTVTYDAAYTLIEAKKSGGYTFVKWQRDGVDFVKDEIWNITENIILDAVMEKIVKITINLDIVHSCCSISSKAVEVEWGAETITLPTPECNQDNHTFKYWQWHNGEEYVELEKISDIWALIDEDATSVITLTANWKNNWTKPR